MRDSLPRRLVEVSVRHSEQLRLYAVALVAVAVLVVTFYPVAVGGEPLLSKRVPIVMLSFLLILALPMLAEYLAVWFREKESVHVCRSLFSLAAVALALLELVALLWIGSPTPATAGPLTVSTLLAKLL
jgi:hypothetical protein